MLSSESLRHMRISLCVSALQIDFWHSLPKPGLFHHSDGVAKLSVMTTDNIWLL